MKKTDRYDIKICGLQDVDVSFFEQLDEGFCLLIQHMYQKWALMLTICFLKSYQD